MLIDNVVLYKQTGLVMPIFMWMCVYCLCMVHRVSFPTRERHRLHHREQPIAKGYLHVKSQEMTVEDCRGTRKQSAKVWRNIVRKLLSCLSSIKLLDLCKYFGIWVVNLQRLLFQLTPFCVGYFESNEIIWNIQI